MADPTPNQSKEPQTLGVEQQEGQRWWICTGCKSAMGEEDSGVGGFVCDCHLRSEEPSYVEVVRADPNFLRLTEEEVEALVDFVERCHGTVSKDGCAGCSAGTKLRAHLAQLQEGEVS